MLAAAALVDRAGCNEGGSAGISQASPSDEGGLRPSDAALWQSLPMTTTVRYLGLGAGRLALSLLTTVLSAGNASGGRGAAFASWLASATFWLGILCVAAHLLATLLPDRSASDRG